MSQHDHDNRPTSSSTVTDVSKSPSIPLTRFWLICIGVCLGLFLAMMDTSIVATSLFTIGRELEELENVNWVALAYTLSYMGCAVVFARISDIVGRRDAFVVAYMFFITFSLACGFARNMRQLIALRAMQGIGGSGLYSLTMVILLELSPGHLTQYTAAMIGMVVAISGILGPLLGGLLTSYTTWRWVFWINGPIGAVSLAIFLLSWPDKRHLPPHEKQSWKQFDYPGSLLAIAAAVLVVFSFQHAGKTPGPAQSNNWGSVVFIAPIIIGIVCWIALILWEYLVESRFCKRFNPVFPLRIFRSGAYTCGVINTLLLGFPLLLLIYIVPLRIQVVGGKSASQAGVMMLPLLSTVAIGSMFSGAVNARKPMAMEMIFLGSCTMLLGCGLLTTLSLSELDAAKLLGFTTLCGMGFGLTVSSSTMIASTSVAPKDHAPAQGILAQMRIFGGSLAIAASTAIMRGKINELPEDNTRQYQTEIVKQYARAFRTNMIVTTVISGVAVLLALAAVWHRRTQPQPAEGQVEHTGEKPQKQ